MSGWDVLALLIYAALVALVIWRVTR